MRAARRLGRAPAGGMWKALRGPSSDGSPPATFSREGEGRALDCYRSNLVDSTIEEVVRSTPSSGADAHRSARSISATDGAAARAIRSNGPLTDCSRRTGGILRTAAITAGDLLRRDGDHHVGVDLAALVSLGEAHGVAGDHARCAPAAPAGSARWCARGRARRASSAAGARALSRSARSGRWSDFVHTAQAWLAFVGNLSALSSVLAMAIRPRAQPLLQALLSGRGPLHARRRHHRRRQDRRASSPPCWRVRATIRVTVADRSAARSARPDCALRRVGLARRRRPAAAAAAPSPASSRCCSAAPYHLTAPRRAGGQGGRRPLSRPHRGRRLHPRGQGPGRWRRHRLHPPVRPGPRLHLHRRRRPRPPLRHPARRAPARRRPAALSVQRAELQSDLVHRRGDQRVLRAVRGHRRWRAAPDPGPGGMREPSPSTASTYEAFNTSGGLGTLCRDPGRQGPQSQLPHHPLSRPRGDHEGAAQRPAPARPARPAEGHPGERRPGDAAGRGDRVRHRLGHEGRPAGAGNLRQQDLRPRDGRADAVSAIQITTASAICAVLDLLAQGAAAAPAASCARRRSRWPTSWPTASAAPTPCGETAAAPTLERRMNVT